MSNIFWQFLITLGTSLRTKIRLIIGKHINRSSMPIIGIAICFSANQLIGIRIGKIFSIIGFNPIPIIYF